MSLFTKTKSKIPVLPEELEETIAKNSKIKAFHLLTISTLFQYMKAFTFDLKEINSDQFKGRIDTLSQQFKIDEDIKKLSRRFESNKTKITHFIDLEKNYFLDKEKELKNIIKILTSGMATVNSQNQQFNTIIHDETLALEKINQLTDIRKIKTELEGKVSKIKQFIQKKQIQDAEHIETLSNKVETLKTELEVLKSTSMADGLTKAFNRLAFDTQLHKLVSEKKPSFSLLMLDIDNFKLINDSYGHQVGDRVLVALVQKCKESIREGDFVARYGGEEFMIIFHNTSLRHAIKKARRLCDVIADTKYAIDTDNQSKPLSFTVSIGTSSMQRDDTVETVVQRADKALYKAKHLGKNQVVSEKEID